MQRLMKSGLPSSGSGARNTMICWRFGFRHSGTCQSVNGTPASKPKRLTIKWSPTRTVFSMEPLGMTRACTIVPSISRNATITQNHETTSRQIFSLVVAAAGFCFTGASASAVSTFTMSLHFQLHELGRIVAGIARGAEFSVVIFHRRAQSREREVAERIGAEKFANLLDGIVRGDQLFAARRIDTVVAGRNRRRAADAHVNFGGTGFADHAHDLTAGRAADDRIVHQDHTLAFEHAAHGIQLELHAKVADGLLGLDEGAADIVVADQSQAKRNSRFRGIPDGSRDPR